MDGPAFTSQIFFGLNPMAVTTAAGLGERERVPFRFVTYTLYTFPMMLISIAICHVYV
jgi:Na+/H+ antiporter NhaD/arsenite permease-like protein